MAGIETAQQKAKQTITLAKNIPRGQLSEKLSLAFAVHIAATCTTSIATKFLIRKRWRKISRTIEVEGKRLNQQFAARENKLTASRVAALMTGNADKIPDRWRELIGDPAFVPED